MTFARIGRITIGAIVLLFAMWLLLFRSGMDSEAPLGMAAAPVFLVAGMALMSVPQHRHRPTVLAAPPNRDLHLRRRRPRRIVAAPVAAIRPVAGPMVAAPLKDKHGNPLIIVPRPQPVIVRRAPP